jgi:hypothetical protein
VSIPAAARSTAPSPAWRCRWCRAAAGTVVLDLGRQPAADRFPLPDDPQPDPLHGLRMVLCSACHLAQLEDDPTGAQEPRGVEPAALLAQARAAVADLVAAGLVPPGARVGERPSPHGGSWLPALREQVRPLVVARPGAADDLHGRPLDLLVDSLGLMHEPHQRAALAGRATRLAPDGVLALHVHPLSTILRGGTWNALRHGHYAYYSLTVLLAMARDTGLAPAGLWRYPLYGGTLVVALARRGSRRAAAAQGDAVLQEALAAALADDAALGVTVPGRLAALQQRVTTSSSALRAWLDARRGETVLGYGAASRAVALLTLAGVTDADLRGVVDASPAKAGRAMPGAPPGSRVPVLPPAALAELRPAWVLLLVPDLLEEVRVAHPEVEAAGGRWVVAEPEPVPAAPLRRG